MIVADLDVVRVTVNEQKADTPLLVNGDGVLTLTVTLERMEAIAGWHFQVVQVRRQIDVFQFACRSPGNIDGKARRFPRREQFPSALVRERLDHWSIVPRHVTRVNGGTAAAQRLGFCRVALAERITMMLARAIRWRNVMMPVRATPAATRGYAANAQAQPLPSRSRCCLRLLRDRVGQV